MFNRNQIFNRIVRLVIFDPALPWQFLNKESIAKYEITLQEVEQLVRNRFGGNEPPANGAAVPKRPTTPSGSEDAFVQVKINSNCNIEPADHTHTEKNLRVNKALAMKKDFYRSSKRWFYGS